MDRLTVAEAALRLGVSQDAIYKRIKRGTIPWDKEEDGKTVVYIEEVDGSTDDIKTSVDESTDHRKSSTDTSSSSSTDSSTDILVDELRDRVRFLEEELRRKDTILMSLVQRVPELESSERPLRDDLSPPAPPSGSSPISPETQEGSQRKNSWWQRLLGG
jgi:excisionase family DNA binding protein